jgi:hypothetical protein
MLRYPLEGKMPAEHRLKDTMVRGLQDFGQAVFALSQQSGYVPVDKGTLKKSGVFRLLPNGFEIAYRTPYAAPVHFGVAEHDERVRQHWVRPFRRRPVFVTARRIKAHSTLVHGHYRGPFTRHVRERAARPWLQDAVDALYPKIGEYMKRRLVIEFSGH